VTRFRLPALALGLLATQAAAADEAKGEKVAFVAYPDYFEKNTSGLTGDNSYEAFGTEEAFAKVFGLRPPLMGGKKSVPVPAADFGTKAVVAAVKRGDAPVAYTVEKVTADGDTLYLQYKAEAGRPGTARFASPLVVAADRGKAKKVAFVENGKTVATVELK
jgi:hypothetical protein